MKNGEVAKTVVAGDVVKCVYRCDEQRYVKGIVRAVDDDYIYLITKDHMHVQVLSRSEFYIVKTGMYIDILGILDEIGD